MVFKELKKEDGYTIAELLIALTIISIVLALASSVFVFVSKQMNTWISNMEFYNNYQVVQNKLFNDLLTAESITSSDTSITINGIVDQSNMISWGTEKMYMNGSPLSISEVDSISVQINNDLLEPKMYQWSIKQRTGSKEMEQNFLLHLRKPILWEPISRTRPGGF